MVLLQALDRVGAWWDSLPPWLVLAILLAGGLAVSWLAGRVLLATLRAWARRTPWQEDDAIIEGLHPSFAVILFVAFFWVALRYSQVALSGLTFTILDNASITVIVLAGALAVARIVRNVLRVRAAKVARWQRASLVGSRIGALVIFTVAFLVVIRQYGLEITPILTTLGLAGLAVALALQDTLANVFSGIWLQTQGSMQPGHYVKMEKNKLEGFVEEVGWRTTKIRTLADNLIVLPNQEVAKETITDYTLPQPRMGHVMAVTTGYEADPEAVVPMLIEEAMQAAEEVSYVLAEPAPWARLDRAAEHGWEFRLGFSIPNYFDQWNAQGYVLNRVRKRFAKEGIRIPYPVREQVLVKDRADLGAVRDFPAGTGVAVAEGSRDPSGAVRIVPKR